MILAMMIGYLVFLHLIFNVFKIVQPSTRNKIYVSVLGCFLIYCVLLVINVFQPMSTDLRVIRLVVPMRPRVAGRVIEVPVKPNVPLKEGDVIFRIEPQLYQLKVDKLKAQLVEAQQQSKMIPVDLAAAKAAVLKANAALVEARQSAQTLALTLQAAEAGVRKLDAQLQMADAEFDRHKKLYEKNAVSKNEYETVERNAAAAKATLDQAIANRDAAQLAFDSKIGDVNTIVIRAEQVLLEAQAAEQKVQLHMESVIDGEDTTIAQLRADLASAEIDLADCVVRAPADGYVTNLSLRPGQEIKPINPPVVTFVNDAEYGIVATFKQEVIERIRPGQEAELAFDEMPGVTVSAKVKNVNWGISQGQVVPSGQLLDSATAVHGRFFVLFEIDNDEGFVLPPGGAGAATIYTDGGKIFVPVRKVFFRWYTWMNYINTEMDIRGQRQ